MTTEITVPALGESVTEATVAKWMKAVGDAVAVDEPLVELETDKVTLEVPSPVAGTLAEIIAETGSDVAVGAVLGAIAEGAAQAAKSPQAGARPEAAREPAEEQRRPGPTPVAAPPAESRPSPAAGRTMSWRCRRRCANWWKSIASIRRASRAPARAAG